MLAPDASQPLNNTTPESEVEPFPPPECDQNGVDRAQIRRLIALTPAERLIAHDAYMNSVFEIWRRNGHQGFR